MSEMADMAELDIIPLGDRVYQVIVREDGSESRHEVTVTEEEARKYGGSDQSVEDLLRSSFEFLLERESKESILPSFRLSDIKKYFPEFGT